MAGTGRKWLIGCGIGCGVVLVLGIVLTVAGSFFAMRPFNQAVKAQKELTTAFGERDTFMPPPETFADDRLAVFLAVRGDLMPMCADFERVGERFAAVEEMDKQEDVSGKEAVRTVLPVLGSVFGMVGDLGRYLELRNTALVERGMGLGEYTWYYVLVYNSWLGQRPNRDFAGADTTGAYDHSDRYVLSTLLAHQAAALREAGRGDEADVWDQQADAVMDSPDGVPFGRGGLPAPLAARLEPWRERLEAVYCEATGTFELGRIRKRGLSIRVN